MHLNGSKTPHSRSRNNVSLVLLCKMLLHDTNILPSPPSPLNYRGQDLESCDCLQVLNRLYHLNANITLSSCFASDDGLCCLDR
jgi:hypothetical protein